MTLGKMNARMLCQAIWDAERKHELLELEVEGVKVWQYMRVPVYYYLAEKVGMFQTPHVQKRSSFAKIQKLYKYLLGALLHNPFFRFNHVDEVVIEHPRSVPVAGEPVDIYSFYYVRELRRKGVSYLCLDRTGLNVGHCKASDSRRSFIDVFAVLAKLVGIIRKPLLTDDQGLKMKAVSEDLSRQFGVSLDLEALLVPAAIKFKVNYRLYRILFRRLRPKRLLVVVSYACCEAIAAAKDLGIETLEMQHGTFSRYHLGYSFPDKMTSLDYFPDRFMAWGSFWRDMGVLPLPDSRVEIFGFPFFNQLKDNHAQKRKDNKRVVVLSQGALGAKIAGQVYAWREALKDFEVVYKLHPGEFARWRDYESLRKLAEEPNVRIVKEGNLYELLAGSNYQIGVFSTAIYEGIGFGCQTLLLDLPGVEYMVDLVDKGLAFVIRDERDLVTALEQDDLGKTFDAEAVFGADAGSRLV